MTEQAQDTPLSADNLAALKTEYVTAVDHWLEHFHWNPELPVTMQQLEAAEVAANRATAYIRALEARLAAEESVQQTGGDDDGG